MTTGFCFRLRPQKGGRLDRELLQAKEGAIKPESFKKLVYFLLFCSAGETQKFLRRCPPSSLQGMAGFYRKAYFVFLKTKKGTDIQEDPQLKPWGRFCLKNSYEEVLAVILFEVLRCSLRDICWIFPFPQEVWEFRRQKGLKALERELEQFPPPFLKTQKLSPAVCYCQGLSAASLPGLGLCPSWAVRPPFYIRWQALVLGSLGLLILGGGLLAGWSLLFRSPPVILYQTPF